MLLFFQVQKLEDKHEKAVCIDHLGNTREFGESWRVSPCKTCICKVRLALMYAWCGVDASCAMLCNMLCYAMLCYAMLCYAMLCYAMLCYAMLCYAMLCYAMLCYAMLCYAMLCYAMLSYPILCYAMLCYAIPILCCAMLCYAMPILCCVMLCYMLQFGMVWHGTVWYDLVLTLFISNLLFRNQKQNVKHKSALN